MKTVKEILQDWVNYKKGHTVYNFTIENELPKYGISYFQSTHQPSTYTREWRKHVKLNSYKEVHHPTIKKCKGWCIP